MEYFDDCMFIKSEDFLNILNERENLEENSFKVENEFKDIIKKNKEYYFFDPNIQSAHPDIYELFPIYNEYFFGGILNACELKWSKRMTLCAGTCSYTGTVSCVITLSEPLLKFRNCNELKETLLHEMIHAWLFITNPKSCFAEGGHGPEFTQKMKCINQETGLSLSVFHTFHDEVDHYRKFLFKCDGPCQKNPPHYGIVKRAMNRIPGKTDWWWPKHTKECGGKFTLISHPDTYKAKKKKSKPNTLDKYFQKKKDSSVIEKQNINTEISIKKNNLVLYEIMFIVFNIYIKDLSEMMLKVSSKASISSFSSFLLKLIKESGNSSNKFKDSEFVIDKYSLESNIENIVEENFKIKIESRDVNILRIGNEMGLSENEKEIIVISNILL